MKKCSSSFFALAAFFLFGTAAAYTQQQNSVATHSPRIAPTTREVATRLYFEDESEWYSPPPAPVQAEQKEEAAPVKPLVVKLPRGVKPKTTVVKARTDLDDFLAQDDRLCVVKFYAAWCKSCQKFNLHFNKLAANYADWEKDGQIVQQNSVRIAEVEWGANMDLCKALGIRKLPAVYFYSGNMKIDGFAVGPSRFSKVRDAVQRYANMSPEELQFEAKLEQGKKLMEETARRERFEEAAKARAMRRRARTTPPRQQLQARNSEL